MPGQNRIIMTAKMFDAEVLAASGTADSPAIDLRNLSLSWRFSLHYITAGSGTLKIEYLLAVTKAGTYYNIGTDIGATLAAGNGFLNFAAGEPYLAPFMKIRITEDGTTDRITVTVSLNYQ